MGVKVAPAQLHIDPVLRACGSLKRILQQSKSIQTAKDVEYDAEVGGNLGVVEKRRLGNIPLVGSKQQYIRTRRVHFVGFTRVDGLLLHCLDLEGIQFLIEDLAEIHHDRFVDLLP